MFGIGSRTRGVLLAGVVAGAASLPSVAHAQVTGGMGSGIGGMGVIGRPGPAYVVVIDGLINSNGNRSATAAFLAFVPGLPGFPVPGMTQNQPLNGPLGQRGWTPFAEESDSSAYAANGKARSGSERDAYAMFTKAPAARDVFAQGWSMWGGALGGLQTTDGNATPGTSSSTSRFGAVAAGADYRFSPFTRAGFALSGGGTNFSTADGTGRSDLFQMGAFVRHDAGAAYVSATLAYGWQAITTDRIAAGVDRLHAEFNANTFAGRVEGGYRIVTPWLGGIGLTPYAAGQFTTFDLPAYAERALSGSDAFALSYASKSITTPRSELGLRTDKSYALETAILTLGSRFAWAHDFNPNSGVAATFQSLPGASFVINAAAPASDSALTTASVELKWVNGWSADATFEGEFSDVTRSYAGRGAIRYAW
jgi:uncharacterized protein with beta-barrel porin domain